VKECPHRDHDSNQNPPDVNRFTPDSYGRAYNGFEEGKGTQKWPMRVVGQGDSYDQPIPFAALQKWWHFSRLGAGGAAYDFPISPGR
jgi:hypothetical protein